jgi:hypothetical protein
MGSTSIAELSKGLSGGHILNICLNAIYAGSTDPNPERWAVTQAMVEAEIAKARKAKAEDWLFCGVKRAHFRALMASVLCSCSV